MVFCHHRSPFFLSAPICLRFNQHLTPITAKRHDAHALVTTTLDSNLLLRKLLMFEKFYDFLWGDRPATVDNENLAAGIVSFFTEEIDGIRNVIYAAQALKRNSLEHFGLLLVAIK